MLMPLLLSSTRTNCWTGNNTSLTLSRPSDPAPSSPPSISWYRRPCRPTPNDTSSNSSPPFPDGHQGRWWIMLHIRQSYWNMSQEVLDYRRYETSGVSSPPTLWEIVLHSWNHPRPWDNLRLYLSMPRWIHLSRTSPPITNIPPCLPPTWIIPDNDS